MDSSDRRVDVFSPDPNSTKPGETFPLIAFMHGFFGGGVFTTIYFPLVEAIASFGYVVVVPRACDVECFDDKASLPGDPLTFAHYYEQQLRVIDWAMEQARAEFEVFTRVNVSAGVGIAGHSMGGQATLFSAGLAKTSAYHIKAAVRPLL
ncbi:Alpha/Beta hydrolase protein [Baffinella frigidus]|nr:Alpha/Beta hydrolase protein [Cryptophyta sp. CCMP2293]